VSNETLLRAVIDATGLSRRKAFAAIREGRVRAGDETVHDPSQPYAGAPLFLDGEPIAASTAAKVYLLLHKPPGYVTTRSDELGRRTVIDLVPAALRAPGLHPVGRLDRDTSGLLILTNDGDLTYRLTHPKHEVEKEYWAGVSPAPDAAALAMLRHGTEIDGALRRPIAVRRLDDETGFNVAITIREGRKRQVRRMLDDAGLHTRRLRRVREGALTLSGVPEGAVRRLTPRELALLDSG
jgi:pseudouridine synthase